MRFDLRRPCAECPFRNDRPGYLRPSRAASLFDALTVEGVTFTCHKTLDYSNCDEEGNPGKREDKDDQHCAGALIMLEKAKLTSANQMLRIAQGLGIYDPKGLDLDSPICGSREEFLGIMERTK